MDAFERAATTQMERRWARFRIRVFVYVAVNLFLIGIYVATSMTAGQWYHPWPIYPILGWGIGIGAKWMSLRQRAAD